MTVVAPPDGSELTLAHLKARLELLESRVATLIEQQRAARGGTVPDHKLRGVYLSDGDIDALLTAASPTVETRADAGIEIDASVAAAVANGQNSRLHSLRSAFDLTDFDLDAVVAVLAPDVDERFEALYGYLNDDVTRRTPSVGLVLRLCGRPSTDGWARLQLSRAGPLVRNGLIEIVDSDRPFLSRSLRVPDRITSYLLGEDVPDPLLEPFLVAPVPAAVPGVDEAIGLLAAGARLLYARESPGASGSSLAAAAYLRLGMRAIEVDLRHAPGGLETHAFVGVLVREAALRGAAVTATHSDALATRSPVLLQLLTELPVITTLVGSGAWDPAWSRAVPSVVEAGAMPAADSGALLRTALGDEWPAGLDWAESGTRLRPIQALRAANLASVRAAAAGRPVAPEDVLYGARQQNGTALERLARRISPVATWQQLVVRPPVETALRQLTARVRHRSLVLDEWGLLSTSGRRRGVTAIFSGPPGTGKTMSAEVVAADLGVDLYVINLATVVDKYIGETEKNLERIFGEAEQVSGVLFFDEADAIFGKRSEVKDARDRYANLEVAYLLQRIEMFDGIAVLATNLKANLDEAFLRRLDLAVDFTPPDVGERRSLWRQMLAPVPVADDVEIDDLASTFELSGGYIRNIVIAGAYLAAESGEVLSMRHLVRATAQEYRKLGRLIVDAEFGAHHGLLGDEP